MSLASAREGAVARLVAWRWLVLVALGGGLVVGERLPGEAGLRISATSVAFVSLVAESLPFLLAGAALAGVLRGGAGGRLIEAALKRPRLAAAVAPLTGAALPLCDCGMLPLARRLRDGGVAGAVVNGFVAGAPLTNPIVVLSTLVAFPGRPSMVIGRVAVGLAVSMCAAAVAPSPGAPARARHHEHEYGGGPLRSVATELEHTAPTLVLGALAAAVIKAFVPTDVLVALGSQPLLGAAAMMALAFVMSICSQADAFVAASLPVGTLPRLAFLTIGPMLDLRLAVLYRREFGGRWLLGYAAAVAPAVLVLTAVWVAWWPR